MIERELYMQKIRPFIGRDVIKVLTGIRRSGKSVLLMLIERELLKQGVKQEQMVAFNFEQLSNAPFCDALTLHQEIQRRTAGGKGKWYFFFDEIQNIDGWERFARRMADSKEHVFITGSNSKMLSKEIEARLGGRYMTKYIMPYSFREFLKANDFEYKGYGTKEKGKAKRLFEQYMHQGGLPETVYVKDKREYVSNVYRKVLLGDIAYRNNIRNVNGLKLMVKKIAESVKDEMSYNKLTNILKTMGLPISKDSIIDYVSYSEDSCLLFPIYNFSAKFVDRETTPKYYFEDNGILNLFLVDADSRLLENLAAIALWTCFNGQVFYLKDTDFDIDFYVPESGLAVQVAYSLKDISNNRETESLVKASKRIHGIKRFVIATYDEETSIDMDGIHIDVIPLWKLLLEGFEQ